MISIRLLFISLLLTPVCLLSQNRYDIVISEIMADPGPQVGLPNNEWIELKNTSTNPVNLQNWRIGDAGGQSGPLPSFVLQPDSFVIICTGSAVAALSSFGTTVAVASFPSLDNEGEQLFLKAATGAIIHAVSYTADWYQNELKKDGGWTLEMIDTKNPCTGSSNWKASISITGGTPGKKNSIDGVNNDATAPQLKKAYTTDNTTILLVFDEPVDSLSGATLSNYSIDGGLSIINAITITPLFNLVQLKTNTDLAANTVYTITASNVTDCKNNRIGVANKARTGLPADAANSDCIVNEILFDPRPNAFDYVELYNSSDKIFDAAKLYIANRNSSGIISSIKVLSATPHYIFPGDYIVITENAANLGLNYLVQQPDNVLTMSSLPSLPDDEGVIILLNFQGAIIDEVNYTDDWHFKLLNNSEGVALERIDPSASSANDNNWHSAASTAGYGTPTYKNSQYKQPAGINAIIETAPNVFSPDNDGRDDIATVQYKVTEPGYIANITIFNAAGIPVRSLVRNGILGIQGYWHWDGLNDKGMKLPVGTYIILIEVFNLQGKKDIFKTTIVLARKF